MLRLAVSHQITLLWVVSDKLYYYSYDGKLWPSL